MLKIKRIAVSFVIIITFCIPANLNLQNSFALEVISGENLDVLPDGTGNFLVTSYDTNSSKIAYLETKSEPSKFIPLKLFVSGSSQSDTINYKYSTANFYGDNLYLTSVNGQNTTIQKYRISLEKNLYSSISSLEQKNIKIESPKHVAVANNGEAYFINNSKIYKYNLGVDSVVTQIAGNQDFSAVFADVSKNYIYALDTSNKLFRYKVSANDFTFEQPVSEIIVQDLKFLTNNIFATSDGYIYTLDETQFKVSSTTKLITEIKNYPACLTAGFDITSFLAKTNDKIVSRFRCSDGAVTGEIEFEENVLALATSGDKIVAVTGFENQKNFNLISASDITEIVPPTSEIPDDNSENENNPSDENAENSDDDAIFSDVHNIDLEKNIISEISVGITFAEFKKNLVFNGYSLVFRDSSGKIKTGNSTKISTGYTVTFVRDGIEKISFKLIVQGDVTGTGTFNSRDISAFEDYLLGKLSLDSDYLNAANINGDGEPDTIDLFLMYKILQK